jgi:hypothetical protein
MACAGTIVPTLIHLIHSVDAGPVQQAVHAVATVHTAPPGPALLSAGFSQAPSLPTPFGPWRLDPATMVVVGVAPADVHGEAAFRFAVDLVPGTLIGLQAAVLLQDCTGTTSLLTRVAIDSARMEPR